MGALAELARVLASRERTSVDAVSECLERIDSVQPELNAFTFVAREQALRDAAEADRRPATGPLHGVPVAVKDLLDVEGWPTSGCSRLYDGRIAASTAPAVRALRDAGAVVVAKTNMHELAFGATGDTSSFGPANNPWDTTRMTGGSSSGSAAAVAAGAVPLALGTDTGGSVRIPASLCGISGLKTTHGRIPIDGAIPLAPTFDTIGPMTRDAEDLAVAFEALTGVATPVAASLAGVRVGVADNGSFDAVDPAIVAAVLDVVAALEKLGAVVAGVSLPHADHARDIWVAVTLAEFLRAHPALDDGRLSPELAALARAARELPPEAEAEARAAVTAAANLWQRAFSAVDVVVMPATPVAAPPHFAQAVRVGEHDVTMRAGLLSSKTRQVNVAGVPAVAMPCGFDREGLPFAVQLAAAPDREPLLLAIAASYQQATQHHLPRPTVFAG